MDIKFLLDSLLLLGLCTIPLPFCSTVFDELLVVKYFFFAVSFHLFVSSFISLRVCVCVCVCVCVMCSCSLYVITHFP